MVFALRLSCTPKSSLAFRGAVYRVSHGINGSSIYVRLETSRGEQLIRGTSFQDDVERRENRGICLHCISSVG